MNGGYDDGYRRCPCFWGDEPGSLIRRLEKMTSLSGRRVLDLGCGEGKNAVYLAQKGCRVDAVDVSDLAIRNATAHFGQVDGVSFTVTNALSFSPTHAPDITVMYGLLHCLPSSEDIRRLVARAKAWTQPGGFHVVCAFNSRTQDLSAHPGFTPTLLSHGELTALYHDWRLAFVSDEDLTETHPHNNLRHTHALTRIIAEYAT